jgi:GTP-binding protein Era
MPKDAMPSQDGAEPLLKCGFAAIVGRPNTGKSTLLNQIVGEKIAIVSPVPQTTRQAVKGILTDSRGQIVFIDTPGWHSGRDHLDRFMTRSCLNALEGVDCVVHLVDVNDHVGEEEEQVVERLRHVEVPIILGLNKVDLKGRFLPDYIALWERVRGVSAAEMKNFVMIPLSGEKGTQVDKLVDTIFSFLKPGPLFYEEDVISDTPRRLAIGDIVREKLFLLMRQEVPHSVAVVIEEVRPIKGKTTFVRAVVLVERDSQKEIVIGAGGQMIRKIGVMAREDLETLMETKVFLELHVRSQKNWRDDPGMLEDLGYSFQV